MTMQKKEWNATTLLFLFTSFTLAALHFQFVVGWNYDSLCCSGVNNRLIIIHFLFSFVSIIRLCLTFDDFDAPKLFVSFFSTFYFLCHCLDLQQPFSYHVMFFHGFSGQRNENIFAHDRAFFIFPSKSQSESHADVPIYLTGLFWILYLVMGRHGTYYNYAWRHMSALRAFTAKMSCPLPSFPTYKS